MQCSPTNSTWNAVAAVATGSTKETATGMMEKAATNALLAPWISQGNRYTQ